MSRRVKERLSKGFAEVKSHWLIAIANLAVWLGGGVLSYIIWVLGGGRVTFGPLGSYSFICLSIVIAITAALNSGIASIIASKSLALTRATTELTGTTTRPFLALKDSYISPQITVILVVKNTGTLPAENGTFKVDIISIPEPDKPDIMHESEIPLIFPNDQITMEFPISEPIVQFPKARPDFVNLVNSGKEIHFRLEMNYRSFEKEYVYGKTLKLIAHQKDITALGNLMTIKGSSYYT